MEIGATTKKVIYVSFVQTAILCPRRMQHLIKVMAGMAVGQASALLKVRNIEQELCVQKTNLDSKAFFSYRFHVARAYRWQHAEVAQLVERKYRKLQAAGSIPALGSKIFQL